PRFGIYVGLHLAAEKPGVGCSGSQWVSPESPAQVRLVLFAPVWIEGRVIGADLGPATDATVHLSREHRLEGEEEGLPSPVSVDAEGRFAAEVRAGGQFEVWVERAGRRSEVVRVYSSPGSRHEITFWLGALSIEGVLRDPSGNTVPRGTVRAWDQARSVWSSGPGHRRPWGTYGGDTDEHGNYRIAVPAPGYYLIAGLAQGFASSLPRDVSVEEGDPHPRVDLTLFEPASISGVVRGESGQPTPHVRLQAWPEPNANPMAGLVGRTASAVFSPFAEARSTEDGSFDFMGLHPTGSYTIRHLPGSVDSGAWRLPLTLLQGVRAGTRGLEIVM
ncbi:MAG: carboxypeptidase-like regulatory domain-containing protein, partial [Planctomycetota bacterium]